MIISNKKSERFLYFGTLFNSVWNLALSSLLYSHAVAISILYTCMALLSCSLIALAFFCAYQGLITSNNKLKRSEVLFFIAQPIIEAVLLALGSASAGLLAANIGLMIFGLLLACAIAHRIYKRSYLQIDLEPRATDITMHRPTHNRSSSIPEQVQLPRTLSFPHIEIKSTYNIMDNNAAGGSSISPLPDRQAAYHRTEHILEPESAKTEPSDQQAYIDSKADTERDQQLKALRSNLIKHFERPQIQETNRKLLEKLTTCFTEAQNQLSKIDYLTDAEMDRYRKLLEAMPSTGIEEEGRQNKFKNLGIYCEYTKRVAQGIPLEIFIIPNTPDNTVITHEYYNVLKNFFEIAIVNNEPIKDPVTQRILGEAAEFECPNVKVLTQTIAYVRFKLQQPYQHSHNPHTFLPAVSQAAPAPPEIIDVSVDSTKGPSLAA